MYKFKFHYEFFDEDPRLTPLRQERKVFRKTDPPRRCNTSVEICWNDDLVAKGMVTQHPTDLHIKSIARKRAVAQALMNYPSYAKKARTALWLAYFEEHPKDKQNNGTNKTVGNEYTQEHYEALLFATNTYINLHDLNVIEFKIYINNVVITHEDINGKEHVDDLLFNQDFLRQMPITNEWEYLLEIYRAVKKDDSITMDEFSQSLHEDPIPKFITFVKAEIGQCFEAYHRSHKEQGYE